MGVWTDHVVPRLTESSLSSDEVGRWRRRATAGLHGRVLELGFGSGLNLAFLPSAVTEIAAVEPSDVAWSRSAPRREACGVPVRRIGLDGQSVEAEDGTFDAALTTFTLCTIPDAGRALAEVRRVLAPGGALHFLEHGLAPDESVRVWQRRLEPMQRRVFAGCHLTRDVPALVSEAGLDVVELEQLYLPAPAVSRPWTFGSLGRAVRPPG
ncbi:class I SAM-dependent methyltransferase [Nocardioides pacificus]